jgi:antitoxin (DNA-binding transcriptional repressor) of toxin-antitoxin stability system
MKTVSIHDAKTNLSKYIAAAKRGEKVFIGVRGEPEVELVYHKPDKKVYRKLGVAKGKIWIAPDAFSKETDEAIAKLMYGD